MLRRLAVVLLLIMLDSTLRQSSLAAAAGSQLIISSFDRLAGWTNDDQAAALAAFRRSCARWQKRGGWKRNKAKFAGSWQHWQQVCDHLSSLGKDVSPEMARDFFERHFVPVKVRADASKTNLFTGYFEPEVMGSRVATERFSVPLYRKPDDLVRLDERGRRQTGLTYGRLVDGRSRPYFTRKEIETGALDGRGLEILWLESFADAFFMQVQGSGRVRLPDGEVLRLAFAAKTGLPYTAIGGVLIKNGAIAREQISMQSIRSWMNDHPGQARYLMWQNESFVFFREKKLPLADLGPPGAQGVQVTPGRTLAVDYRFWPYIAPMWLETDVPGAASLDVEKFQRLMIAQDTGTAIKGLIRGDIFFGAGEAAAFKAGHMKNPGQLHVLLPKGVVRQLGL